MIDNIVKSSIVQHDEHAVTGERVPSYIASYLGQGGVPDTLEDLNL